MPSAKPRPRPPTDAGRSAVRRNFTGLPAEWAELDALAARLGRPGYPPNASATLHACVRAVLDLEADGLVAIGPVSIRPLGSPAARSGQ